MVQKAQQRSSTTSEDAEDTTTPDTTRSKEVVEGANCCLANIDDLLDECDTLLPDPDEEEPVVIDLPAWHPDAEWDSDDAPETISMSEFVKWFDATVKGDSDALWALWARYEETLEEREEEYNAQHLDQRSVSRRSYGGCVC